MEKSREVLLERANASLDLPMRAFIAIWPPAFNNKFKLVREQIFVGRSKEEALISYLDWIDANTSPGQFRYPHNRYPVSTNPKFVQQMFDFDPSVDFLWEIPYPDEARMNFVPELQPSVKSATKQ